MELKDLKSTDYYYAEYVDSEEFVIVKGIEGRRPNLLINKSLCKFWMENKPAAEKNIRLATPEEKHWLDWCILANKYVEYEEAIKHYVGPTIVTKEPIKDPELDKILIKLLNL